MNNKYCNTLNVKAMDEQIEKENDAVNHPKHYCRDRAMESIDEMLAVFGAEAVMNFCICNVWKYRYRASSKNGEEDLKKSDWYMNKYIELKTAYVIDADSDEMKKMMGAIIPGD